MKLVEAMRQIGPGQPPGGGGPENENDSGEREAAAAAVWEALQGVWLPGFSEETLEQARAGVFERLWTRRFTVRAGTDFQCKAYLRRAVVNKAIDLARRQKRDGTIPPPPATSPGRPPRVEAVLGILEDAVTIWGSAEFSYARDRLLSSELLKQTSIELVDIARGARSVREVLSSGCAVGPDQGRRVWSAYKRRCQRTIRALLLTLPGIAVSRGWVDDAFRSTRLQRLGDLKAAAASISGSDEFEELVTALIAVASSYQRALAGEQL
jgi:hypothetical protein